jgi:hypothetical protein
MVALTKVRAIQAMTSGAAVGSFALYAEAASRRPDRQQPTAQNTAFCAPKPMNAEKPSATQAVLCVCYHHGPATVCDRWRPVAGACGALVPGRQGPAADLAARDREMGNGHGEAAGTPVLIASRVAGPVTVTLPSRRPACAAGHR